MAGLTTLEIPLFQVSKPRAGSGSCRSFGVVAPAGVVLAAQVALAGTALAQSTTGGGGGAGDFLFTLLPIALIFLVFYILLIRPQQKRIKEHKALVDSLRRGDRVITGGGLIGTVVKVSSDEEILVELCEGVRVKVVRATISGLVPSKSEAPPPAGRTSKPVESKGEDSSSQTAGG